MTQTSVAVDRLQAWLRLFKSMRDDLLELHMPTLRQMNSGLDVTVEYQEALYQLSPTAAMTAVLNRIINRYNTRQNLRVFGQQLRATSESLRWVEVKAPFRGNLANMVNETAVHFPKYTKRGDATYNYAAILVLARRFAMLADICEQPRRYAVPLNDRAVYDWFLAADGLRTYDSWRLLAEIKAEHEKFITQYRIFLNLL